MSEPAHPTSERVLAPAPPPTTARATEPPHRAGLVASPPTVERVTDARRLAALVGPWDALVDESHPGAVFRSPAWLLPWWNHFSAGKELRVYAARRGGALVGLLPAYRVPTPLGGARLRLLGDNIVGSDYLGAITAPGDHAAVEALARALVAAESDICFDGMLDGDPLLRALADAGRGRRRETVEQLPCPLLDVRAAGEFRAWLDSLPSGAGQQLLRRRRWLEKRPGFAIDVATDPGAVSRALAALWPLHRARWAVEGGSDALDGGAAVEAFHDEAARELARRGWARVYTLSVEGAPRAALYGFVRGPRFSFYQSGNAPEWRQRSVGTVVLCAAIEDAFRAGLAEFDFLRGSEAYKRTYASGERRLAGLRVTSGPRASLERAVEEGVRRGRRMVKELLPDDAVTWIRRQRKLIAGRWAT